MAKKQRDPRKVNKKSKMIIDHGHENHTEQTITRMYFNDVGKHAILTPEEENHYANLIKKGDKKARDIMIENNLRLVVKMAIRYLHRGLSLLDLIEEGNLGLMHAVTKFNPDLGFRFSTYATWWIRQSIERAIIIQSRVIRLPTHVLHGLHIYHVAKRLLENKLQRSPTLSEISKMLDTDIFYVAKLSRLTKLTRSMTSVNMDIENVARLVVSSEPVTPEESAIKTFRDDYLYNIINQKLSHIERDIIIMRFGLSDSRPLTLKQVAVITGYTQERVRQIQLNALKKLEKWIKKPPST